MDARVASAVSNWAPRFTTNGVAVGRLPAGHREPRALGGLVLGLVGGGAGARGPRPGGAGARGGPARPGAHLSTAAVYYHFGKFLFVEHPDEMRAAHGHAVACLTDALPYLDPAGRADRDPVRGQPAGRHPAAAGRRRAAPGRRDGARAGLDQGGVPLDRGAVPRARPGDVLASTGRGRARPSTTCRSAATGRCPGQAIVDARGGAARHRPRAGSASGA